MMSSSRQFTLAKVKATCETKRNTVNTDSNMYDPGDEQLYPGISTPSSRGEHPLSCPQKILFIKFTHVIMLLTPIKKPIAVAGENRVGEGAKLHISGLLGLFNKNYSNSRGMN